MEGKDFEPIDSQTWALGFSRPIVQEKVAVPGKIEGSVIAISESGNLVTDISADQLSSVPTDDRTAIRCDEHYTNGLYGEDHQQPEFTFIAILRDGGQLELEIVGDSAKMMLGIGVGEKVSVQWD